MKKGIIAALSALAGGMAGVCAAGRIATGELGKTRSRSDKYYTLYLMMNQWVKVKQEGKNLSTYFTENRYKKIAIYGIGYAGKTLLEELAETEVEVAYGIDKNAGRLSSGAGIDVLTADESLEEVDAVVVTAVTYFDEIEEMLREKVSCPIISLEDILYEL